MGSAVGFLRAPVAYQVIRSGYQKLSQFDPNVANKVLGAMQAEAIEIVKKGSPNSKNAETRTAYMRYLGQGHEVAVDLPCKKWTKKDSVLIRESFETAYEKTYGRLIPNLDIEIVSWAVEVSAAAFSGQLNSKIERTSTPTPYANREIMDPGLGELVVAETYRREQLIPGDNISGPAIIVEDDTSTVVSPSFDAQINALGYIVLEKKKGITEI